jgi:hypothetical protein
MLGLRLAAATLATWQQTMKPAAAVYSYRSLDLAHLWLQNLQGEGHRTGPGFAVVVELRKGRWALSRALGAAVEVVDTEALDNVSEAVYQLPQRARQLGKTKAAPSCLKPLNIDWPQAVQVLWTSGLLKPVSRPEVLMPESVNYVRWQPES